MKKIVSVIALFVIFMMVFSINIYAAQIDGLNTTISKEKIYPGETVTINIKFGQQLGSYKFDFAYDKKLFEYVSAEGGKGTDDGTKVQVYFYDESGGSNPNSEMSITFKAKEVDASNPTNFSITANGLASPDGHTTYDDITVPIVKNITVEPKYVDYDIKLTHTGDILKGVEKEMKLVVSSSMGKNYEHTRIIAEATTPKGATVKLLGTDEAGLEHDIIQSGWGSAEGDPLGGKNAVKELNVRGLFSEAGKYTIKFKVIDRDDSDKEIATKSISLTVVDKDKPATTDNKKPTSMPKTGNTVYVYAVPIIATLTGAYLLLKKKH